LPYLTLIPSITSLKRLLSCSSPGLTTRLMGRDSLVTAT
jgi:hypothetical protein